MEIVGVQEAEKTDVSFVKNGTAASIRALPASD